MFRKSSFRYFFIICFVGQFSSGLKTSLYSKTSVFEDKCFDVPSKQIDNVQTNVHCLTMCSLYASCKRSMYCGTSASSPNTCSLYRYGQHCIVDEGAGFDCECFMKDYSNCESGVCECPVGKYGHNCQDTIADCSDTSMINIGGIVNKVSAFIKPPSYPEPFELICEFQYSKTRFLHRDISCTHIDFNRTYDEYVKGFGKIRAEYWLGLEKMSAILDNKTNIKIGVGFNTQNNAYKQAFYKNFVIGPPFKKYSFNTAQFSFGSAGDALFGSVNINNRPFSTFDNDSTGIYRCPSTIGGGWWYAEDAGCTSGNLNAPYNSTKGIHWNGYTQIKSARAIFI